MPRVDVEGRSTRYGNLDRSSGARSARNDRFVSDDCAARRPRRASALDDAHQVLAATVCIDGDHTVASRRHRAAPGSPRRETADRSRPATRTAPSPRQGRRRRRQRARRTAAPPGRRSRPALRRRRRRRPARRRRRPRACDSAASSRQAPALPCRLRRVASRDRRRARSRPTASAADVVEVMDDVVQEVLAERRDRERRAVAASSGAIPRVGGDVVEDPSDDIAGSGELLADDRRILRRRSRVSIAVASWSQLANSGSSWSSISSTRSANSTYTSRTWHAYSSGDQTSGDGRSRTSGRVSTASQRGRSARTCAPISVGYDIARRQCRTRGTAATGPRSSPWCQVRWPRRSTLCQMTGVEPPAYRTSPVSFTRRGGRLTERQQNAWDKVADTYVIDVPRHGPSTSVDPSYVFDAGAVFGRTAPLVVEIGSGRGEALVHAAKEHPDHDFLGLEVYVPGVAQTLVTMRHERRDQHPAGDRQRRRGAHDDAARRLGPRAAHLVPRPVAQGAAPQASADHPGVRQAGRARARAGRRPAHGDRLGGLRRADARRRHRAHPSFSGSDWAPRFEGRPLTRFEQKGTGRRARDSRHQRRTSHHPRMGE